MSGHDLSSNSPSREFMDRANEPTTSLNTLSSRKRPAPIGLELNREQCAPHLPCSSKIEPQIYENSMESSWPLALSNTFYENLMMSENYLNEFTDHQNAGQNMRQPYVVHGWPVMHSPQMNHNFLTHADLETHFSEPGYPQQGYFCSPGPSASQPTEEFYGLGDIQPTPSQSSGVQASGTVVPYASFAMTAKTCSPNFSEKKRKLPSPIKQSESPETVISVEQNNIITVICNKTILENRHVPKSPKFGTRLNRQECTVVEGIDGRLPAVAKHSKYNLTVEELKRRCGSPENMNLSGLYSLFRKTKNKEYMDRLKRTLLENDIYIKTMKRQKKMNRFSSLLEEEAIHLARDIDSLTETFMPVKELGHQMLDNMLSKGFHLEQCANMLNNTRASITQMIETLEKRQPRVTGKQERLQGNNLDMPYHIFSVVTHGFGHPNSLTYYKGYLAITTHAVSLCEQIKQGTPLPGKKIVYHGQKPFENMSHESFITWQTKENQIEEERRMKRMHRNSQRPLQQINRNMQEPYFSD